MTEKVECKTCKEPKPQTAKYFHKDPLSPTGFRKTCKECRRKAELDRWHKNKAEANAKRNKGKHKDPKRMCVECRWAKSLNSRNWQAEKRKTSGYRQPCKACLKKREIAKKCA